VRTTGPLRGTRGGWDEWDATGPELSSAAYLLTLTGRLHGDSTTSQDRNRTEIPVSLSEPASVIAARQLAEEAAFVMARRVRRRARTLPIRPLAPMGR
jgi:hypothetical protein